MIVWKSEFDKVIEKVKLDHQSEMAVLRKHQMLHRGDAWERISALEDKIKSLQISNVNEIAVLRHQFNQLKDIMGAVLKANPPLGEIKVYEGDLHVMETGTPKGNGEDQV